MASLRWAFNFGCWRPTLQEWITLMAAIQSEERNRINRFHFQHHAKAALNCIKKSEFSRVEWNSQINIELMMPSIYPQIGRILIRKAVSHLTGLPNDEIHLDRTEKGKPFLTNSLPAGYQFDFNVSHDGNYAVLAAETSHSVGIDIVQLDRTAGAKSVDQFFATMSRQLTPTEWTEVRSQPDERVQLMKFYRYWCLKESYVKSLGIGVGLSLDRLTCQISSSLTGDTFVVDTQILVDEQHDASTRFEEFLLDERHAIAVALKPMSSVTSLGRTPASTSFKIFDIVELLEGFTTLSNPARDDWVSFSCKPERPVLR